MNGLLNDLRYGLRALLANPGFAGVVILTLALGIGANTAIFSVVNAVLLRPLPFSDPDRLAMLWTDDDKRGIHEGATPYLTMTDWRRQSQLFSDMAIFTTNPLTLTGLEGPERVKGEFVSANLFPLLGIEPVLGQTFSRDQEEQSEHVVVLSYGLWQRRYGGAPDVLGKSLDIDGDQNSYKGGPRTPRIIGVMPPSFYFPDRETQLWEPATVYWRWKGESVDRFYSDGRRWGVVGRLKPGATVRDAQAEMTTIGQLLTEAYRAPANVTDFPGFAVNVVPLLDQITGKNLKLALWILLVAVGFVLLMACANVANLLLARGTAREREFAIRTALGAPRGRLLRQLLTESAVLAGAGGLLGLALAAAGVRSLVATAPRGIPRLDEVRLDTRVLLFTVILSLVAGLVFGLVPALKVSRSDPNQALKEGGAGSSAGLKMLQGRGLLVAIECALAVVLLISAGLLIHSFLRLQAVDPGFKPEGVLLARVSLPPDKQRTSGEATFAHQQEMFSQFAERIAALPGVQRAGAISNFLIKGTPDETIEIEGRPPMSKGDDSNQLASTAVSPGFFETMGVPLKRGRFFTRADAVAANQILFAFGHRQTPPEAVVVNETFARRFFPGEDPIGKHLIYSSKKYPYEIIGVAGDMHRQGLEKEAIAEYFVALRSSTADIVVRTGSDPLTLTANVRDIIRLVEGKAMVLSITTVESQTGELSAQRRFQTGLLALFAGIALTLAMVGIYGVMHYAVAQRTQEIGIRVALGARSSHVLRLVIGQGMKLTLIGLGIGLIAELWLTDVMAHFLFGVSAHDPWSFGGVALLLAGVALLACYIPARRAMRVDPMVALRYE
jgi:putative ABC transport system permease protein